MSVFSYKFINSLSIITIILYVSCGKRKQEFCVYNERRRNKKRNEGELKDLFNVKELINIYRL